MKSMVFTSRNIKELVRDPVSIIFGVGLPIVLLAVMNIINSSIQGFSIPVFELKNLVPGMAMFSLSFLSLFGALLVAGDRGSSYLTRLLASPMKSTDFITGYTVSLIPLGVGQSLICFLFGICIGLDFSWRFLLAIAALLPTVLLFSAMGLLLGSILNAKQSGPLSSIIVQVCALGSGMWFDLDAVGGGLKVVCDILPFSHCLNLAKHTYNGNFEGLWVDLLIVLAYVLVISVLAVVLFGKKMYGDKK